MSIPLSRDILRIVLSYAIDVIYINELHDSIPLCRLTCEGLSINPLALDILRAHPNKIRAHKLARNPHPDADALLQEHLHKTSNLHLYNELKSIQPCNPLNVKWYDRLALNEIKAYLIKHSRELPNLSQSSNPEVIKFLEDNLDKVDWAVLSNNPIDAALDILESNIDKINWILLSRNTNDRAIRLLESNIDKINWNQLCHNTNSDAIRLLEGNLDKFELYLIASNTNPNIIPLLKIGLESNKIIDWESISKNCEIVFHVWHYNPNKVNWHYISASKYIFKTKEDSATIMHMLDMLLV